MAAAPANPCMPPEIKAALYKSFVFEKPAKRENSGEVPSMQICLPQPLRFKRCQRPAQRIRASIKDMFKGDGSNIEEKRTFSGIKGVASRLSVLLLAGPLINPSIKGIIAAEAMKEVKRKSALRNTLSRADKSAVRGEAVKARLRASRIDKGAGKFSPKAESSMALMKPPR